VTVQVGVLLRTLGRDPGELRRFLAPAGDAGVDHVAGGDHVSFWAGAGRDGLIDATTMAMAHPTLPVHVAVYLLALRHPVLVARQLSTLRRRRRCGHRTGCACQGATPPYALRVDDHDSVGQALGLPADRAISARKDQEASFFTVVVRHEA